MLRFNGVVESVLAFSYSEVGFLTTQKFTHEIPANTPQTGARNPARISVRRQNARPPGGNSDAIGP